MRKLIYHVAMSLDSFIAGDDDSIDLFPTEGDHIEDYVQSLLRYDTAIMGRRTYEFGYRYGMKPGENPYPHMKSYVFSQTLDIQPENDTLEVLRSHVLASVGKLKAHGHKPIYLCGGGNFAGYLMKEEMIDELWIKLSPITIGSGIKLFGNYGIPAKMKFLDSKTYDSGVVLLKYAL